MRSINIGDKFLNLLNKIETFFYRFCNNKTSSSDGVFDVKDAMISTEKLKVTFNSL